MSKGERELALWSKGCSVSYASCGHEEVASCRNIVDGSRSTFWTTTGFYPHHFTLSLPALVNISCIKIRSYYVKSMLIEKSTNDVAADFDEVESLDMELSDLHHQVSEIFLESVTARHLKFTVRDSYEEFCAVYKVEVRGCSIIEEVFKIPVPQTEEAVPSPLRTWLNQRV